MSTFKRNSRGGLLSCTVALTLIAGCQAPPAVKTDVESSLNQRGRAGVIVVPETAQAKPAPVAAQNPLADADPNKDVDSSANGALDKVKGQKFTAKAGGLYVSDDGLLEATFPPGSLSQDTEVRMVRVETEGLKNSNVFLNGIRYQMDIGDAYVTPGTVVTIRAKADDRLVSELKNMYTDYTPEHYSLVKMGDGNWGVQMAFRGTVEARPALTGPGEAGPTRGMMQEGSFPITPGKSGGQFKQDSRIEAFCNYAPPPARASYGNFNGRVRFKSDPVSGLDGQPAFAATAASGGDNRVYVNYSTAFANAPLPIMYTITDVIAALPARPAVDTDQYGNIIPNAAGVSPPADYMAAVRAANDAKARQLPAVYKNHAGVPTQWTGAGQFVPPGTPPAEALGAFTPFAGPGFSQVAPSVGDGGAAIDAKIRQSLGITTDSTGNLYIADSGNNRIRKVGLNGKISTVVGNGTAGFGGDGGAATSAQLKRPTGVSFDSSGNMYIADTDNQRIRKVTPGGIISTVAGTGTAGALGDGGAATSAQIGYPSGVAVDSKGNIFIADKNNHKVRRVDGNTGVMTTFAGTGAYGIFSGEGGPATAAQFFSPSDVEVDGADNLLIADSFNNRIRKVSPTGIITTVAGVNPTYAGEVYNYYNDLGGDGGPATSAKLNRPHGLSVDNAGNIWIAETYGSRVRMVTPAGIISTKYQIGGLHGADTLFDVVSDNSGNVYVNRADEFQIYKAAAGAPATVRQQLMPAYAGTPSQELFDMTTVAISAALSNNYVTGGHPFNGNCNCGAYVTNDDGPIIKDTSVFTNSAGVARTEALQSYDSTNCSAGICAGGPVVFTLYGQARYRYPGLPLLAPNADGAISPIGAALSADSASGGVDLEVPKYSPYLRMTMANAEGVPYGGTLVMEYSLNGVDQPNMTWSGLAVSSADVVRKFYMPGITGDDAVTLRIKSLRTEAGTMAALDLELYKAYTIQRNNTYTLGIDIKPISPK